MKNLLKPLALLLSFVVLLPIFGKISFAEGTNALSFADEELPKVELFTDSGKPVTEKVYEGGTLSMTLPARYAAYQNRYTTAQGDVMKIRCRGNSTYETAPNRLGDSGKYSYKIQLDSKEDLLGMGESRHWVLIANYYDVTNLRNKLAYDLSGAMGLTYTQSRWVVVYLNGDYQGLYTLCENVRIDEGRVEITDWEERAETIAERIAESEGFSDTATEMLIEEMQNDLSWVTSGEFRQYQIADYCDPAELDIDSGYLLEYDMRQDGDTTKFTTGQGVKIQLDSPTALNTNDKMFAYVTDLIEQMEEAFGSETFCTADGVHYSEFVDMQSLVDYFILFQLFKNIEFGWLSIFLYIEDGMIYFGPAWDFDGSAGNQVTLTDDWMNAEQWFNIEGRAEWWKELCGDPYFVTRVEERWQTLRPIVDLYMETIPLWKEYIAFEAEENFAHFGAPINWYMGGSCTSFESEYETLVDWLNHRIVWLEEQWSLRDPNMEGRGIDSSEKLTMELTYEDGSTLSDDTLTVSGTPSDYLYDLSRTEALQLTVTTQHTSHQSVFVYVNGMLCKETALDLNTPAKIEIPRSMLQTASGAVNVIYIVGHNGTDYYRASYLTVRMAEEVPSSEQFVVRVGDQYLIVDQGGTFALPEIAVHADGFQAAGWTDGTNLYPEGRECVAYRSAYLWIDWERTDLLTEFHQESGKQSITLTPTPVVPSHGGVPSETVDLVLRILLIGVPVLGVATASCVLYGRKRKRKKMKDIE